MNNMKYMLLLSMCLLVGCVADERVSQWSDQQTKENVFKETDKINAKLDKVLKELEAMKALK